MWEQRFIFIWLFIYLFLIKISKFFFTQCILVIFPLPRSSPPPYLPNFIVFLSLSFKNKNKQTSSKTTTPQKYQTKQHDTKSPWKKSIDLFLVGQVFLGMWAALEEGWNVQWHSVVKKRQKQKQKHNFSFNYTYTCLCGYMHMSSQKTVSGPLLLN